MWNHIYLILELKASSLSASLSLFSIQIRVTVDESQPDKPGVEAKYHIV